MVWFCVCVLLTLSHKYISIVTIIMCCSLSTGPKCDYLQAREYIAKMFINVNQERSADIYPHFTCATDTENIKFVFDVVKNHILQQHIVEVIPGL